MAAPLRLPLPVIACSSGPCPLQLGIDMRIRYILREGVRWEVIDAGESEVVHRATHVGYEERLLYFISRFEVRRYDAAPREWYRLDEDALDRLCTRASPVALRGPYERTLAWQGADGS